MQEWIRNQLTRPNKAQAVSGNTENPRALRTLSTRLNRWALTVNIPRGKNHLGEHGWPMI